MRPNPIIAEFRDDPFIPDLADRARNYLDVNLTDMSVEATVWSCTPAELEHARRFLTRIATSLPRKGTTMPNTFPRSTSETSPRTPLVSTKWVHPQTNGKLARMTTTTPAGETVHVWYSYDTVVAYQRSADDYIVHASRNEWTATTARHLRLIRDTVSDGNIPEVAPVQHVELLAAIDALMTPATSPRVERSPLGRIITVRTHYVSRPGSNVGGTRLRWVDPDTGKPRQRTVAIDQSSNDPQRAAVEKLWPQPGVITYAGEERRRHADESNSRWTSVYHVLVGATDAPAGPIPTPAELLGLVNAYRKACDGDSGDAELRAADDMADALGSLAQAIAGGAL